MLLLYYGKLEIEDVHIFTVYHAKILEFLILKNIYFTSAHAGEGKRLINSSFISGCRVRSTVHQGTQEPCRIYRA